MNIDRLIAMARAHGPLSPQDKEVQRRSFAYGNTAIENERITREMIAAAAERVTP